MKLPWTPGFSTRSLESVRPTTVRFLPWFIQAGTALLDNRYLDVEPEVYTRRSQGLSMVENVRSVADSNMQVGRIHGEAKQLLHNTKLF